MANERRRLPKPVRISQAPVALSVTPKFLVIGAAQNLTLVGRFFTADMQINLGEGIQIKRVSRKVRGYQITVKVTIPAGVAPRIQQVEVSNRYGMNKGPAKIELLRMAEGLILGPDPDSPVRRAAGPRIAYLIGKTSNLTVFTGVGDGSPEFPKVFKPGAFMPSDSWPPCRTFRWSTDIWGVVQAVWQVSIFPFPQNYHQWQNPAGLIAHGALPDIASKGKTAEFDIDFGPFVPKPTLVSKISHIPLPLPPHIPPPTGESGVQPDSQVAPQWQSPIPLLLPHRGNLSFYVRVVPLNKDGNPAGPASNPVVITYGPRPDDAIYFPTTFLEVGREPLDPDGAPEFPNIYSRSWHIAIPDPRTTAWPWFFRWSTRETGIATVEWQIRTSNRTLTPDNWRDPTDLLDFGQVIDAPFPQDGWHYFQIDLAKALKSASPLPGQTEAAPLYVRIIPLNATGKWVGKPSWEVTIIPCQQTPLTITLPKKVTCQSPQVEILSCEPFRRGDSSWAYWYEVVKEPDPIFANFFDWKVGDRIYLPPKTDKDFWDYVGGAIKDVVDSIGDFVDWVSEAWDSIKEAVVHAITSMLDSLQIVDCGPESTCEELFTMALNSALLACGIPPSLPNFDQLVKMGEDGLVEFIADEVADQTGIPDKLTEEVIRKVAEAAVQSLAAQAQASAEAELILGCLRPVPEYYDNPANVTLKIFNAGSEVTEKTKIFVADSLQLFKPVNRLPIPSLHPGQEKSLAISLEMDLTYVNYGVWGFIEEKPLTDWWTKYNNSSVHDEISAFTDDCICRNIDPATERCEAQAGVDKVQLQPPSQYYPS
jgi:hypothetical protein